MRYIVSEIILSVMKDMDPHFPVVTPERLAEFSSLKESLEKEIKEQ